MDPATARNLLFGINLFFGLLFLLAPRLALRLYGLDPNADRSTSYALRYFGGRLLLLATLLGGDEQGRRLVLRSVPVIAATDAAANLLAACSKEVPKQTVVRGAATSAVAVAIGLVAGRD